MTNRKYFFSVSKGSKELDAAITSALETYVLREAPKIPYDVIDRLIATAYAQNDYSYAIYVLAPNLSKKFTHLYYTFFQGKADGFVKFCAF